ncbi:MAG: hypothetical protein ACHQVK_01755 [Candidatus Paceibacterales bacterium]
MKNAMKVLDVLGFIFFFGGLISGLVGYHTRVSVIVLAVGMGIILIFGAINMWKG